MCGIAGIVSLNGTPIRSLEHKLNVMGKLIAHRGPDDDGIWCSEKKHVGLAHRRLSILDLSTSGAQPMAGPNETVIVHNGEVYNYIELIASLKNSWPFKGSSDTEAVLAAYAEYGQDFVQHLRGMFATAIYDEKKQTFTAIRDRFGIKPFFYAVVDEVLYFASEAKALLPFLNSIETDPNALAEYLTFQYTIGEQTLFKGVKNLKPGHQLTVSDGAIRIKRYWDVKYDIDWDHSPSYFNRRLRELMEDSVDVHLRSDVPIGGYMSGGIDSSLISILAANHSVDNRKCFHGKFTQFPGYDESPYAKMAADSASAELFEIDITADDFRDNIEDIIYHLDFPIAGPGSFPQYMVSKLAAEKVKVVLGGQGGDEIFGGYARYLVAYLEQCLKAAMDGNYKDGNFVVTLETIIPNMGLLREYKPMMQQLWSEGLFGELDARYFRLIDRSADITEEVDWSSLDKEAVFGRFQEIFNSSSNVGNEAYFDKMTHYDFKCLLPALLHVEDRMSMAHGLESRVPMLDHEVVEFAASIPADVKFEAGNMKHLLKTTYNDTLPDELINRRDKMGFPVPLKEWFGADLKDFVQDTFSSTQAKSRPFMRSEKVLESFGQEARFSRKTWGLLSLEIWHQQFHDKADEWKKMVQ